MDSDFNFKQVPRNWSLCYLSECPRHDECLRYQACLHAPDGRVYHRCILPSVIRRGDCQHFRPVEKMRMALGFRNIFNNVLARDIAKMRAELMDFLGSSTTFYRYRSGEYPLSPLQQQWIRDMFRRRGYSDDIAFDSFKDVYIFD